MKRTMSVVHLDNAGEFLVAERARYSLAVVLWLDVARSTVLDGVRWIWLRQHLHHLRAAHAVGKTTPRHHISPVSTFGTSNASVCLANDGMIHAVTHLPLSMNCLCIAFTLPFSV